MMTMTMTIFVVPSVGVVGEVIAFIAFLSLSITVFLESIKHMVDVAFIIPKRESDDAARFTAHGHGL